MVPVHKVDAAVFVMAGMTTMMTTMTIRLMTMNPKTIVPTMTIADDYSDQRVKSFIVVSFGVSIFHKFNT